MTNAKNTKRALLLSVLSMLLCVAMLAGSTFAWFTDSVSTGVNKIVAGNLDIELEYKAGVDSEGNTIWKAVDPDTSLFKPTEGENATLWEPGHTEYVQLRIRNAGTLALKYQLRANVYKNAEGKPERTYTNMLNKKFKLSDYLVFSKTEGAKDVISRESLWLTTEADEKAAMGADGVDALAMKNYKLLPGDVEEFTLAVYMPTWVGNEANQLTSKRANEGEPTIFLSLNLSATQTPHESDSFDNQYDKGTLLPGEVGTAAELAAALGKGGTVTLVNDIVAEKPQSYASITKNTVIDLNGNTITGTIGDGTFCNITIKGDKNSAVRYSSDTSTTNYGIAVYAQKLGTKVTLEGGTYIGGPSASCIYVTKGDIVIKDGYYKTDGPYNGKYFVLNMSNSATGSITVYGGSFENYNPAWGDDNTSTNWGDKEASTGGFVAEGYTVTHTTIDGNDVYTVVPMS